MRLGAWGSGLRVGFSGQAAETSTAKPQRTQSLGESGERERRGEFIRLFNIELQISVEICPMQIYGAVASARQAHQTRLILQRARLCAGAPVPPRKIPQNRSLQRFHSSIACKPKHRRRTLQRRQGA